MERTGIEVVIHTQILFCKFNAFPKIWSSIASTDLIPFLPVNDKAFIFITEIIKQDRR